MKIKTVVKKIKEIKDSNGETVNEYIVYQMINKQPITATLALGEVAKDNAILKYNN
jgi:hypothetical protein